MTRVTMPWSWVSRAAEEHRVAAVYVARGRKEATELTDGADLVAFDAGGTCEVEPRTLAGELALSLEIPSRAA